MSTPPKKRRPIEEVRAELMESQETKQIAEQLGLSLEDYVAKVLEYYQQPEKEPQVYVASEEQLRAAGFEPPSQKEAMEWLEKVQRGEIDLRPDHLKDGYKKAEKPKVAGIGEDASGSHTSPPELRGSSALKDQVRQQLRGEKKS